MTLIQVTDMASMLALLVGTLIPLLTGLLTDQNWSPGVKFAGTAFLSAVTAVLSRWLDAVINDQPFQWATVILSAVMTLALAELTYVRGWKRSAIGQQVQSLGVGQSSTGRHEAPVDA